jgi:hypothetical protein
MFSSQSVSRKEAGGQGYLTIWRSRILDNMEVKDT